MIFIVIPVFNRWVYTKECLLCLQKQDYTNYKIIVVDDGSTDGTANYLQQEFPNVIVIKGDGNLWWTAATNLGVVFAQKNKVLNEENFVLTLNNDTLVPTNFLTNILSSYRKAAPFSLIGATAVNAKNGQVYYRGEKINWFLESSTFFVSQTDRPENGLQKVTVFPGRGLLISLEVFDTIGLFDEKSFPHYAADYDFTLRANKAGFGLFCSWDAIVEIYPDESGSVQIRNKKTVKNYFEHIFGMKGAANIVTFVKYTFRHCPFYAIPFFLTIGLSRRIFGYFIK